MIERSADHLRVTVPMVMANANGLLAAGRALFAEPIERIDLADVAEADSSSLAVMIAWLRMAREGGRQLAFLNLPSGVRALAALYGVDEILPLA